MWCGPNDGGIKRGDRADTGDNQARPNDGTGPWGSGVGGGEGRDSQGFPTADPSSEGARSGTGSSVGLASNDEEDSLGSSDLDDLDVRDASDPSLGLTDIGAVPPKDWAANTGPTRSAEEKDRVRWDQLKSSPERKK